jgi:hypothetical protein
MDFDKPENLLRALVKLRGSLDGAPALWWYRGNQYAVVDSQPTLLWQVEGAQLGKFVARDDGSYEHVFRDVMFYLDAETSEFLREFKNPWTGQTHEVPVMRMGPFRINHSVNGASVVMPANMPPGAMDVDWRYEPSFVQGGEVYIRELGKTRIANPAASSGKPGVSSRSHFYVNDLFTLVGKVADIEDDTPSAPARSTYDSVNDWTPWLQMGNREGFILGRGNTSKLGSYADLPERLVRLIKADEPGFFEDPDFPVWDRGYHPLNQD